MLFTRKLGKIFRGASSPGQLIAAAILGTCAGFLPGLAQAPGLLLSIFLLVVLLNVNLAVVGISLLLGKFLSLLLMPAVFSLGGVLLDGPARGLFAFMVNSPLLAFFGFEYYATAGGLATGLLLGAIFGWGWAAAVKAFRRKMSSLETGSPGFQTFVSKGWVKLLVFIFIGGGHGNKTYADLLQKRRSNPIRPLGLVAVGGCVLIIAVIQMLTADWILKAALQNGLERANGATVDIGRVGLGFRHGHLKVENLAMADPEDLGTDLFRASVIEADVAVADLLRKRFHLETLRIRGGSTGEARSVPGIRHRPPEPLPPPPPDPSEKTLEDYLEQARLWRDRLVQIRSWLDRLGGSEEAPEDEERPETRRERLERQIREMGYRNVRAEHLIAGAPTVLISLLAAEEVGVARLEGETLDIHGENLSTHPRLVEKPASLTIRSSGETLFTRLDFSGWSAGGGDNLLRFHYLGLPVDAFAGNLRFRDDPPLSGGDMDVRFEGRWSSRALDFPLEITLRNTRLSLRGVGETTVDHLALPLGVRGPWENPRIVLDDQNLADALVAAGKAEMARRIRAQTERVQTQVEERVGSEIRDRTRGVLEGILPGRERRDPDASP